MVAGSMIGGIRETQEMLDFCSEHGITCNIERIDVDYVNTAMERLARNDVRCAGGGHLEGCVPCLPARSSAGEQSVCAWACQPRARTRLLLAPATTRPATTAPAAAVPLFPGTAL